MQEKLVFEEVMENNFKMAIKIQQKIFPKESGKNDIIDSVKETWPKRQFMQKYWMPKFNDEYVGIVGIYAFRKTPKDAWIGWYGILPEFRAHKIGISTFIFIKNKAKELGFETIRLYTDELSNELAVQKIYKKNMQLSEEYLNEKGLYYYKSRTLIFSSSLTDKDPVLWNNKSLYLIEHEEKNAIKKLKFVEINKENVKDAGKIQHAVFANHNMCGYADYLDEIKTQDRVKNKILPVNFIVYNRKTPIGMIGLYEIKGFKDDIFLDWFCVLPEHRKHGFGTHMLSTIIEIAKKYDKKYFRLFTSPHWHKDAQRIYLRSMDFSEDYINKKDDKYTNKLGWQCRIFSLSLFGEPVDYWNNTYIRLKEELELNQKSINLLKQDGIIN